MNYELNQMVGLEGRNQSKFRDMLYVCLSLHHSSPYLPESNHLAKPLTNAGEGNQNVDENIEDDSEEEDDSDGFQKENTDSDDD
nr:hypothetical protein CFP56_54689 [Quercus suber]